MRYSANRDKDEERQDTIALYRIMNYQLARSATLACYICVPSFSLKCSSLDDEAVVSMFFCIWIEMPNLGLPLKFMGSEYILMASC